jgi:hypothetical protein
MRKTSREGQPIVGARSWRQRQIVILLTGRTRAAAASLPNTTLTGDHAGRRAIGVQSAIGLTGSEPEGIAVF